MEAPARPPLRLRMLRHLWGVPDPLGALPRFKAKGYEGIEFNPPEYARDLDALADAFQRLELPVVVQVLTSGPTVQDHLRLLRERVEAGKRFQPFSFAVQSGYDSFSDEDAALFFRESLALEADLPVPMLHETHRGRILCNPWRTRHFLERFPELKLIVDFSHFVCVCERLLEDLEPAIRAIAARAHHLHTRLGHEQGPQVPDPRAPEFARHLAAHEQWWSWVWDAAAARGQAQITATPEFGPPPYQPTLPYTGAPLANLEDICDWMAARNRAQFAAWSASRR